MKTRICIFCLVVVMCLSGCSAGIGLTLGETTKYGSYEEILTEYTKKLKDATPILIEEYNEAAKDNQDGLMGLATLCNEKVSELAVISNEGIQEMAEFYFKKGSGAYSEYSEWASKLQDVYMEEASKIQDVYMDSAT